MILTVTPNPCVDKTVFIDELRVGTFMRAPRYTCIAGGKGVNVARAANILGGEALALVVVGGRTGQHVVDMITADGIECLPVFVDSPTRTITTVLEEPAHRQTAFFEPGSRITKSEFGAIVSAFSIAVSEASVVVLSGTVSDRSIAHLYAELIPLARRACVRVLLDSHGPEFAAGIAAKPDLIKPNVAETEELLATKLTARADQWRAIDRLHERGIETIVLSLGKDGALVSDAHTRLHVVPPTIKEVNPVGSGDALLAGFAVGLERGIPLAEMAKLGVAAGTANAMSWDIGHFTRDQVNAIASQITVVTPPGTAGF